MQTQQCPHPKLQPAILGSIPPQLLVRNKFPANVLASAVMKVCIGTKIFSRIQSRPIAKARNTFLSESAIFRNA